jgi:hypothetical protein
MSGANTVAVHVYQPGYSHFAYIHRGMAGLLATLVGDGGVLLTTDTGWRVRRDPSFAERVPRVSIYSGGVEERDLRLVDDWAAGSYDDAQTLRKFGRSEAVIEIVRRRWGRWARSGYPTVWENWDVDFPDGSQCHAFSAHPRYHLAEIAREQGGV